MYHAPWGVSACCERGKGALPPGAVRLPPPYFNSKENSAVETLLGLMREDRITVQAAAPMTVDEEDAALPAAPGDKRLGGAFLCALPTSFE